MSILILKLKKLKPREVKSLQKDTHSCKWQPRASLSSYPLPVPPLVVGVGSGVGELRNGRGLLFTMQK